MSGEGGDSGIPLRDVFPDGMYIALLRGKVEEVDNMTREEFEEKIRAEVWGL